MRLEIFVPPDKKALHKDDRRSPLFTIFLPYSLNRVRGCCYPRTVINASLGFRWTVHVLCEDPSILCLYKLKQRLNCFCFAVSLHLCTDGCVCKLQILVLVEDRWHASRWSLPQSPSGQQQRYAQAAENEQLSSCLSSRCAVVLPDILVKCIVVFIKLRGINDY